MTCRDEILACFRHYRSRGRDEVALADVVGWMRRNGTTYEESTIRTHITSRMCRDAPRGHAVTYDDLIRVDRGVYRLAAC